MPEVSPAKLADDSLSDEASRRKDPESPCIGSRMTAYVRCDASSQWIAMPAETGGHKACR
jgi:hypothetical protein